MSSRLKITYMNKYCLWLPLLLIFSLGISAQEYSWTDPPPILDKSDSLTLQLNSEIGLYVIHTVKPYESIYRLVNFFQSDMESTLRINDLRAGRPLIEGSQIRIPLDSQHIITNFFGRSIFKKYNKVYVQMDNETTLYRLSKKLDAKVSTIEGRNDIEANNIPNGAILRVGWFPRSGLYDPITTEEMKSDGLETENIEEQFDQGRAKGSLKEERGIAYWNKSGQNESGFFALHRTADVGSYLEITNPMFGTKVFAKVIGKIPENSYPKEIMTIISFEAAEELRAKDARFFVKIRYLQQNARTGKL